MNLIDRQIEGYKRAYYDVHGKYPTVTRKGGWFYVNDNPTAHRTNKIGEFTANLISQKEALELAKLKEQDEPEDIRALISAIRQDGRNIYHKKITRGSDIKQVKEAGRRISKMAKRILNIMDKEGM